MEIFVVGKQWMWKVQHPDGVREINEMHVPIGRNVRLTLGSEDVIHDYSIPAFRVKMDVVPGKLTTMWFKATVPGTYHLFCAEYCGTKHSGMIGQVIVDDAAGLRGVARGRPARRAPPAQNGERLFTDLGVRHVPQGRTRPAAARRSHGVFGSDGGARRRPRRCVADENYLRESIMNSQAKVVAGYQPIMPTFQGQVSEEKPAAAHRLHQDAEEAGATGQMSQCSRRVDHDPRTPQLSRRAVRRSRRGS